MVGQSLDYLENREEKLYNEFFELVYSYLEKDTRDDVQDLFMCSSDIDYTLKIFIEHFNDIIIKSDLDRLYELHEELNEVYSCIKELNIYLL